jgi:signal transduction histidine kinase
MALGHAPEGLKVLILAPLGRDARLAAETLAAAGLRAQTCGSMAGMCAAVRGERAAIGAVVLAAETLASGAECARLSGWLRDQEPWSDLPIVALGGGVGQGAALERLLEVLKPSGAVSVLERPMTRATLVTAVQAALRLRCRQLQVQDLLAELAQANRAKDRFLAALSHELRTPLTPVQLALFTLQAEEQLSPAGHEALAMIGRNLELERQLIDDLLDVSRLMHGKLELRPEPIDLHGCVRAALEVCRSALAAKGLQVRVELEATNPVVVGEAARLQQVFWNLLHNAAKFTPEGGTVTVRSQDREGGVLVVEVSDTGAGIAPGLLTKLFDPFEQGEAEAAHRHGGLGLGLAICRGIVQAHGGRVWAMSVGPGRGATFTVELPAWPPPPAPAPAPGPERRQ